MNDDRTFVEGYIEGWKSVMGAGVAISRVPSHAIPIGKRPYQEGLVRGMQDAQEKCNIQMSRVKGGGGLAV